MSTSIADYVYALADGQRTAFFRDLPETVKADLEAGQPAPDQVLVSLSHKLGVPDLLCRYWVDTYLHWRKRQTAAAVPGST
jgi:hypothetical protein